MTKARTKSRTPNDGADQDMTKADSMKTQHDVKTHTETALSPFGFA
jgi:hypothetical protein